MAVQTIAEYEAAQRAEWGTWVATSAIDVHGARAFNVGDAVPASHVESGVVSRDLVAHPGTQAAEAAAEADPSDPTVNTRTRKA